MKSLFKSGVGKTPDSYDKTIMIFADDVAVFDQDKAVLICEDGKQIKPSPYCNYGISDYDKVYAMYNDEGSTVLLKCEKEGINTRYFVPTFHLMPSLDINHPDAYSWIACENKKFTNLDSFINTVQSFHRGLISLKDFGVPSVYYLSDERLDKVYRVKFINSSKDTYVDPEMLNKFYSLK